MSTVEGLLLTQRVYVPDNQVLGIGVIVFAGQVLDKYMTVTLPETNMETHKGPYEDYSPSRRGLYGFPC